MIIRESTLDAIFIGFKTMFNGGFSGAKTAYKDVAMTVPSSTSASTYAWLGQMPKLREWVGERVLKSLSAHGYKITNRLFESSVTVKRIEIEDDQIGIYNSIFQDLGRSAAEHPDELVFSLLAQGFESSCYDGQNFFDNEHPIDPLDPDKGTVSNFTAGGAAPWFLLDTSRAIRPIIYQERMPYELQRADLATDSRVVMKDEYLYGVRARCNAGFGLWQLAHGSTTLLDDQSFATALAMMQSLRGDEGRLLGIRPNLLVVGPEQEYAARRLLKAATQDGGGSNPWVDAVELIVTPWLGA